jgi:hypothetical protein
MTAPPPDHTRLAAMLRILTRTNNFLLSTNDKTRLHEYIKTAEDTIEAQAAMLRADLTDLQDARRHRHEWGQVAGDLGRQCDRLKNENSALRQLVSGALIAAELDDDGEGLDIIRQALERTS